MEKSEKVAILKGAAGRNVDGLLLVFGITADEVLRPDFIIFPNFPQ